MKNLISVAVLMPKEEIKKHPEYKERKLIAMAERIGRDLYEQGKMDIREDGVTSFFFNEESVRIIMSLKVPSYSEIVIPNVTKNTSEIAHCDRFICEKCGIHLKDWARVKVEEYEDGYKDEGLYEYEFEYCPNCGAKVVNNKEDNINTNNCAVWSKGKCYFNGRNENDSKAEM